MRIHLHYATKDRIARICRRLWNGVGLWLVGAKHIYVTELNGGPQKLAQGQFLELNAVSRAHP